MVVVRLRAARVDGLAARGDGVQPRLWYAAAAAGSARLSAKSAPHSVREQ